MRIGCCAYSYRQYFASGEIDLIDFIGLVADMGLDGVELTAYYFPSTDINYLHSLKRRCLEVGIDVSGAAVGSRLTLASHQERAEQVAMVKEWIGHAVELGAPQLRVFAGDVPDGHTEEEAFAWTVEALSDCASVAASRGVVLALENHGGITSTADQVIRLVETVDSDWVRVNLDTGNFKVDPYKEMSKTVPYAVTAHIKAAIRTPEGKTPMDIERLVRTLQGAGYRGFLNIEYEEEEDPKTAVPRLAEQVKTALERV
jgi:sugar phosphate isomerase/epimerase